MKLVFMKKDQKSYLFSKTMKLILMKKDQKSYLYYPAIMLVQLDIKTGK